MLLIVYHKTCYVHISFAVGATVQFFSTRTTPLGYIDYNKFVPH